MVAAVRLRRYEMALGDIFGTNLFNTALLFLIDALASGPPVLGRVGAFSAFGALLSLALTAIFMAGVIERRDRTVLRSPAHTCRGAPALICVSESASHRVHVSTHGAADSARAEAGATPWAETTRPCRPWRISWDRFRSTSCVGGQVGGDRGCCDGAVRRLLCRCASPVQPRRSGGRAEARCRRGDDRRLPGDRCHARSGSGRRTATLASARAGLRASVAPAQSRCSLGSLNAAAARRRRA